MNMTGRFKCPECKGEGYVWTGKDGGYTYQNDSNVWVAGRRVSVCDICEGHKIVLTDKNGTIVGPDAPPQYLCEHKDVLTKCGKCSPPHHKPCIECFSTTCTCMEDSF